MVHCTHCRKTYFDESGFRRIGHVLYCPEGHHIEPWRT